MTSEENDIIEGCKKQKPLSQKALYDRYSAKMFAVCLRYARNKQDAEDIFQEAFIKTFNIVRQFSFIGSFEGWLRKIFVTCALNYYRSAKVYVKIDEVETDVSNTDFFRSRFTPEELISAINALPDNQRFVFNLVEVEGYSYDEASAQMNIPNTTARVLNHRAKSMLKKILLDKENFNL
ncbi:MAG: RNA polymerase sigma factor [Bacteroidales bacterium]|jgi:RNA polymerase sigma-70 factor (ECF subfamily)|nr:RNA polymerase sigma factor [Bacteroidales bacterium]